MPPVGFEPTISACVGPQTYVLDSAAKGIDQLRNYAPRKLVSFAPVFNSTPSDNA
jgi:hypothetical protein